MRVRLYLSLDDHTVCDMTVPFIELIGAAERSTRIREMPGSNLCRDTYKS